MPYTTSSPRPRHYAIVGAGMAGISCARALMQAGHQVSCFEAHGQTGGRTLTLDSPCGSFDAGAQYFTVRQARFQQALDGLSDLCRPWSVSSVRVLDAQGQASAASPPPGETHWVASPGMQSLVQALAAPLQQHGQLQLHSRVTRIARDPIQAQAWQLHCQSPDGGHQVHAGFDAVLLALPAPQAQALLTDSAIDCPWRDALAAVDIAPCWTLLLGFAQAVRPGLTTLGPQWNAARSTHHRIAWLARESSKPGRSQVERWTVQANPAWSQEHRNDSPERVQAKLSKAFTEVTGIHAQPSHVQLHLWQQAQTQTPLGQAFVWDASAGLGACGDWCLGYRLEDAFISGLDLAQAAALSATPTPAAMA